MKLLDNMKISAKIALSSGAILVLLLVASGITVFGLVIAQQSFGEYRLLAMQTNAASTIQGHLLAARQEVQNYLLYHTDQSAKAVIQRTSQAQVAVQQAGELFVDAERKERVQEIAHRIDTYSQAFRLMLPVQKRIESFTGELHSAGTEAEQAITTLMQDLQQEFNTDGVYDAGRAMRHLLIAQLYANRFLVENQQEQIDRVEAEVAEFNKFLASLDHVVGSTVGREMLEKLNASIGRWSVSFQSIAEGTLERNGIVDNRLDRIGPAVAEALETLKENNQAQQNVIGPRATQHIERSLWVGVGASVVALIFGVLSAILIGRGISGPIVAMTGAMSRLAGGDKEAEIPAQGRRDEVGQMAAAVQIFKENMLKADELSAAQEAERAAREQRAQVIEMLTRDFDQAVAAVLSQLGSATSEMQTTASSMSATAEETSRQATVVAAASEQASANVQTVATAAEELSSSIQEIGRQVAQSSEIAGQASQDARKTNAQVEGLAAAAQKIGEVVNLIQDIAEQTNLLALNATIEAARAGEAGKGFAVVASEVKNLATQTAKATEEIGQQIGSIQTETSEAVGAIRGIGATINQINEIAAAIASAVEEQGAATNEISRNVQEAAKGTQEVSTTIASVTQAAGETGAAADQVTASAGNLAQQSQRLRQAVEEFLSGVRAA